MTALQSLGLQWFSAMLFVVLVGIYVSQHWSQFWAYITAKLTRRRMARDMNHRSQWGHVWHRRRGM